MALSGVVGLQLHHSNPLDADTLDIMTVRPSPLLPATSLVATPDHQLTLQSKQTQKTRCLCVYSFAETLTRSKEKAQFVNPKLFLYVLNWLYFKTRL